MMQGLQVFNKRDPKAHGVYIGRPSCWGNRFVIGRDGTREEVVAKFERYLLDNPALLEAARRELRGKDLICWCAPLACHGDVLLRLVNEQERQGSQPAGLFEQRADALPMARRWRH